MSVHTQTAGETPSRASLLCAHQTRSRGSIYNGAGCGRLHASPLGGQSNARNAANTEDVVGGCALIPLR